MPEEEVEEDNSCLEALQVAADEGMRACRSAKCNRWQCQALATLLGNLVAYSRHWGLFFSEQFRGICGVKNVVRELVKSVEAAKHLACEYCEKDWVSKALVSQENPLGFQGVVQEIEKYVGMINNHLVDGNGILYHLKRKIELDNMVLRDFLQEAAMKDMLDLNLKVEEQLRNASAVLCRNIYNKLATKLRQRSNTDSMQSTFDIEASELVVSEELLGKGSGGRVYKATWLGLPVAVKVASRDFSRETDIMRGLQPSHPNVVQIMGASEGGKDESLVMELMDRNLREFLISEKLSLLEKVDILLQIANGVLFLHQNDVCYRDLKPHNVLVKTGPRLQIKLADFGVSRNQFRSYDRSLTVPVGTTQYMAPECLMKKSYSRKADVFSFSITSAQVLTGEFSSAFIIREERLGELSKGQRPRLPQGCPKRLKALIKRCWEWEPEKRPAFEEIKQVLWEVKEELLIPVDQIRPSIRLPEVSLLTQFAPGSNTTIPRILDLKIEGDCKVGAKLTASWNFEGGTRSCLVQWGRYLVGNEEADFLNDPMPTKATKSEFVITPDYLGTCICVAVAPVARGLQPGEQARSICGSRVSLDAKSQKKLDSYLFKGHAKFDVKIEGQVLAGRIQMSSNDYQLWWSLSKSSKNFREKYSAGVSLEASQEEGEVCFLKSSIKNNTYRLKFSDMRKRNLAVLTMLEFMGASFS